MRTIEILRELEKARNAYLGLKQFDDLSEFCKGKNAALSSIIQRLDVLISKINDDFRRKKIKKIATE